MSQQRSDGQLAEWPFKIRTITRFICEKIDLTEDRIAPIASFLQQCKAMYEENGYEVQTVRLATRALQQLETLDQVLEYASKLENICLNQGITFISLGSTGQNGDLFLSQPDFISDLAASLTHTSFTVAWQPMWGLKQAKLLAREIFRMAELTNGGSNFRFGVGFNCPPGIPFFPAAESPERSADFASGFAIGTENSGLLYQAFQIAATAAAAENGNEPLVDILEAATSALKAEMEAALTPLQTLAMVIEEKYTQKYGKRLSFLGFDTSIAPALEPPTIPQAFELLGLGKFGASGTLAVTERITQALKSVDLKTTGYCGLMLPVCEDAGLAEAAATGALSIQTLLAYSSVCGVGLDTVPVPGPGPETTPEERERLIDRAAAVLLDVAALSMRLNRKPLTVRLLPMVGAKAGEMTAFNNPYLVESAVMDL